MKKIVLLSIIALTQQFSSYGLSRVMNNEHLYCVNLAGGSGERIWPLSRKHKPKQLLEVGNRQTLLDQAVSRVVPFTKKENILISTTASHAPAITTLMADKVGGIVIEPGSRNTGPAILLSCLEIYQKDPQAIILFLPSDAFIPEKDTQKFIEFMLHGIDFAQHHDRITLFGVKPTFPATGYGYIEFDNATQQESPFPVKRFHEKPTLEKARQYCDSGLMLWNIGMFCAQASVFIAQFKEHTPKMYADVVAYKNGLMPYEAVLADSIDFSVLEKSRSISVLPVDFAWCDVGNIEIFLTIKQQHGGLDATKVITTQSENNLIDVPHKLVALVGVRDLCVIETDQVLLITKRDEAEKVRDIIKILKQGEFKEYL